MRNPTRASARTVVAAQWHGRCYHPNYRSVSHLPRRALGTTGMSVSILGLGAGPLGDPALAERDVEHLLRGAVDLGITLVDTARSYGLSETRIGRYLAPVRDQVLLSTKLGYGIDDLLDWTGPCVTAGVDAALARLCVDCIDVVHLHSCPSEVLLAGDVIEALDRARAAGKLRAMAYAGDNRDLATALSLGVFDVVQTSLNLCDQRSLPSVARAAGLGLGVIAKRPLANAPWRLSAPPRAADLAVYWERWQALALEPVDEPWPEHALRFTAYSRGVSCAIVGTTSLAHLEDAADAIARGPLAPERDAALRARFAGCGPRWRGVV
jgi:aryl-alcohol dehydrogenase-like predicted oxidoreductase